MKPTHHIALVGIAFLMVMLVGCSTPPSDEAFDRQLEAAIAAMFNPDGSPRQ